MIVAGLFNITKRKGWGFIFNCPLSKFFQRKGPKGLYKMASSKNFPTVKNPSLLFWELRKFGIKEVLGWDGNDEPIAVTKHQKIQKKTLHTRYHSTP